MKTDLQAEVVSRLESRHILHQSLLIELTGDEGAGAVLAGEEGVAATRPIVRGTLAHIVHLNRGDIRS